jgi:hypothetical protein
MDLGMAGEAGTEAMAGVLDNIDPVQSLKPLLTAPSRTLRADRDPYPTRVRLPVRPEPYAGSVRRVLRCRAAGRR